MITVAAQSKVEEVSPYGNDPMTDHPAPPDTVRQRATNLFQYLASLVELRTKMVRDCASYERVFWVGDLPREPECHTPAWSDASEDGAWLRIDKPAKPVLPEPPEECRLWVNRATLTDRSQQPALLQEVTDPESVGSEEESDEEDAQVPPLRLDDFPDVAAAWETYLEAQWRPWCEQYERWERVQEAYRQLFGIYQLQRRRGEQFELVLGIGTLLWKTESGHRVCRPVITAQATIRLESVSGCITVGPAEAGDLFTLEQDMLEVEERPPVEDQRHYEAQVANLETVWNRQQVFEILRSWVNTLPVADAEFSEELSCPERATKSPTMVFAPVLMLRRRSGQTLRSAIKKALDQLQTAAIPLGIREVCGDFAHRHQANGGQSPDRSLEVPDELLFPLPANNEQADIVHRLNGHPGILVQGPPGTGKSHTIANLICHFLAHGKRVPVTSQTPRALKVLHDKLPEPLRALCVSVLGNDQGSLRSLEQSVHRILSEVSAWDSSEKQEEIQRVTQERRLCLSELAYLRRLQREAREGETLEYFVVETPYHNGTCICLTSCAAGGSGFVARLG